LQISLTFSSSAACVIARRGVFRWKTIEGTKQSRPPLVFLRQLRGGCVKTNFQKAYRAFHLFLAERSTFFVSGSPRTLDKGNRRRMRRVTLSYVRESRVRVNCNQSKLFHVIARQRVLRWKTIEGTKQSHSPLVMLRGDCFGVHLLSHSTLNVSQ